MATEGQRRRKNKTKAKAKRASGPAGMNDLPDHVLELVLLRVGSSFDLIHAAFTCKPWRRIIAEPRFLSRFRSLHAPHVAGHYYHDVVDPCNRNTAGHVFLPAPSSSRDALIGLDPCRFSLDFLPDPAPAEYGGSTNSSYWELVDSRGGLLLFHRCETRSELDSRCYLDDLLVCEPLTRRCQGILAPTGGKFFGLFLLDGESTGGGHGRSSIGISNFRVVASLYDCADDYSRDVPSALVFHSGTGWREPEKSADIELLGYLELSFAGRANGSFYWAMEKEPEEEDGAVLALDEATMNYSLVTFPGTGLETATDASTFRVVQGEGAASRVVRLTGNELTVFARHQGLGDWVPERRVDISEATLGLPGREEWHFQELTAAMIVAANARFVLVAPKREEEPCWIVSVELDTMQVERADERIRFAGEVYPYELPWPPALQACTAHRRPGRRHR